MSLTRPDLDALPSYVPGRTVPGACKLASNEVPYGPLPGVVEAITEAAAVSHRYPDMGVVALREKLAARCGVDPQRISTGCGSVALAEHLVRATTLGPQDEVLYSWRSFYGDEPNVVVLRTLSKAWGLAGLRIGYAVASPAVSDAIRKVVTPFSASAVAQAAALAALDQEVEMRRRAELVVTERERVQAAVQKLLPEVPDTQSNFVWLPLRERSVEFAAVCEQHGVIVRPFPEGVRVTIGTADENDKFLAAAEAALNSL